MRPAHPCLALSEPNNSFRNALSMLHRTMRKDIMMTAPRSRLGELIATFGNAIAAAAAVNAGRQPLARDLRALGIDPERFRQIKRF